MDVSVTGGTWRNTGDENISILNVSKKAGQNEASAQNTAQFKAAMIFLLENMK